MEDLLCVFKNLEVLQQKLDEHGNDFMSKLRVMLHGTAAASLTPTANAEAREQINCASPQQTKKRVKRLSSLHEDDELTQQHQSNVVGSARTSNSNLLDTVDAMEEDVVNEASVLTSKTPVPVAAPRVKTTASKISQEENKMVPSIVTEAKSEEHEFLRPQRAAKLKSEKNLKEPSLNKKMRRPSNDTLLGGVHIKQEHEQRQSQIHNASTLSMHSKQSNASVKSSDSSLVIVPEKEPSVLDLVSETEEGGEQVGLGPEKALNVVPILNRENSDLEKVGRQMIVKIKREKLSVVAPSSDENETTAICKAKVVPPPKILVKNELSVNHEASINPNITDTSSSTNTTTIAQTNKKGKKKKLPPHRPIKVERFSDVITNPSPISSRTRQGSVGRNQRQGSIYEDAVEDLPGAVKPTEKLPDSTKNAETPPNHSIHKEVASVTAAVNETITIAAINTTMNLGTNDATFQVDAVQSTFVVPNNSSNPNATVTLSKDAKSGCDATFNVPEERQQANSRRSPSRDNQSMVTARDTSKNDSLITEDESFEPPAVEKLPPPATNKIPTSAKAYKMPTRTHELFNPLVQSPVKKKVEAFEELGKPGKTKLRTKENTLNTPTQPSLITPIIGKLAGPAIGRFLTPTQSSNITPNCVAQTKKQASSASKVMPFPKSTSCSNLKATTSSSAKTAALSRENSADDFRRLAEERKKQREQKHLLAAQQREAKEKERAERMAKLAKEREEKRLKKQMEQEQKKKQLDEIQRKLKQQEQETDMLKKAQAQARAAKIIQEQERDLLQQMKPPKGKALVPLPPKFENKYTFEMLHEDDSTDDEEKVTYKRPAPPLWSRSHMRGPQIDMQQCFPTDVIDSFFSVQPTTPDLKSIFPNIDARHLKRNSSVFWSTPPRYSELPKY